MRNSIQLCVVASMMCSVVFGQASLRLTKTEEDTLRVHYMDIVKVSYPVEKECEVALQLKYKVPKEKSRKLAYYVKERERRKACYNYIYRDSLFKRVRCKMEMDSVYRDSINTLLIPVEGNNITGDNISLALMLSSILKLDKAQYRYIMEEALSMARLLYRNPRANVWNDEMNILKRILTPEQLDRFFLNKNSKVITNEVDKGWKRIVGAGLAEQLDSAKEVPRAYLYYHKRQKIKDMFRYYGTSQKNNLAELDKHKPLMVRMLDKLNKDEKIIIQKETNKKVGKEFVW